VGTRNRTTDARTTVSLRRDLATRLRVRALEARETLADYMDSILSVYLENVDRAEEQARNLRGRWQR